MPQEDIQFTCDGQPEGFGLENTKLCLTRLAKFHTCFWNKSQYKKGTKMWDIAGYWTGNKREANKADVKAAWEKTLINFGNTLNLQKNNLRNLGKRLEFRLNFISREFEAMAPRTLLHGDYKVSNVFVKSRGKSGKVYAIDWQWFGFGNCAGKFIENSLKFLMDIVVDVMYFMTTSTHKDLLEKQVELAEHYHSALLQEGVRDYPFKTFWRHFQICYIDFVNYCICSKWQVMSPKDIEEYRATKKDGLHLRSYPHMQHLIDTAQQFLDELDREHELKKNK